MAKKPKIESITRKNNKFTFKWAQQEDNIIDQQAKYATTSYKIKSATNTEITFLETPISGLTKSTKSDNETITLSSYDGDKKVLQGVGFEVRGKYQEKDKKGKVTGTHWTEWADKSFDIKPPTVTLTTEHTATNATKFSWSTTADTTGHKPVNDVVWQTILVKDCSAKNVAGYKQLKQWNNATDHVTTTLSGNRTETETGLGSDSYTRIFRVRARGAGGSSDWKYGSYCYGTPYPAENMTASVIKSSEGLNVSMSFNNPNDGAHRISNVVIQYNITTPLTDIEAPSTGWQDGWTLKDETTSKASKVNFDILNESIGLDEVLFVRVKNVYGDRVETNDPIIPTGGFTKLTAPTIDSVTDSSVNHTVQITATNKSSVPDSFIIVGYVDENSQFNNIGTIDGSGQHTDTFNYPTNVEPEGFAIYAMVAGVPHGGAGLKDNWISDVVYEGGLTPKRPTDFTLESADKVGVMKVSWTWNWNDADQAEVSWTDYEHAWESTDPPETYEMAKVQANYLYITGLETGIPIYVRIRFIKGFDDYATYSAYSDTKYLVLESAPDIPALELSKSIISASDETKASWVYVSKDGSEQAKAQIAEWDTTQNAYGDAIIETNAEQFCNISGDNWTTGTTHLLGVRVWSSKGQPSEWSEPVSLTIAEPITCTISNTSLVSETIDIGDNDTRSCLSLKAMPFTINLAGVGTSGTYRVLIKRAEPYSVPRPDDSEFNGYKDETICIYEQQGNGAFTINASDDLLFDDEGFYTLVATVMDDYGQSDSTELDFEVHWTVQALMPDATVTINNKIARITPRATAQTGSKCDIYRLSADSPQLILKDGTWNKVYIDPYPAIGSHGGYRVVFKTANGDYVTDEGKPAWKDIATNFSNDKAIINFNGEMVELYYNVDESSNWAKDFTQTKYLGGSVHGYWNVGYTRTGAINTVAISILDEDMINAMRRLAAYAGVCHIRTLSGYSYDADIQVSEDTPHDKAREVITYTMSVTRVDGSGNDAVDLTTWEAES